MPNALIPLYGPRRARQDEGEPERTLLRRARLSASGAYTAAAGWEALVEAWDESSEQARAQALALVAGAEYEELLRDAQAEMLGSIQSRGEAAIVTARLTEGARRLLEGRQHHGLLIRSKPEDRPARFLLWDSELRWCCIGLGGALGKFFLAEFEEVLAGCDDAYLDQHSAPLVRFLKGDGRPDEWASAAPARWMAYTLCVRRLLAPSPSLELAEEVEQSLSRALERISWLATDWRPAALATEATLHVLRCAEAELDKELERAEPSLAQLRLRLRRAIPRWASEGAADYWCSFDTNAEQIGCAELAGRIERAWHAARGGGVGIASRRPPGAAIADEELRRCACHPVAGLH